MELTWAQQALEIQKIAIKFNYLNNKVSHQRNL